MWTATTKPGEFARQLAADHSGTDAETAGASPLAAAAADGVRRAGAQFARLALPEAGRCDHAADDMASEPLRGFDRLVVGECDRDAEGGEVLWRFVGKHPRQRARLPRAACTDERDVPAMGEPVRELALDRTVASELVEGDVVGGKFVVAERVRQRVRRAQPLELRARHETVSSRR